MLDSLGNAELVDGFNTSVCETENSVIGRHKYAIRHLQPLVVYFFILETLDSRNKLGIV